MIQPLLSTKLRVPPRPRALVARPRLVARLEEGLAARLILVSAPAGFGKTTLLAQWLHGREAATPLQAAWLSLDCEDDDPARFLAYVVAALQTLEPRMAEGLPEALRSPQPPPVESLLAVLVNDAAALLAGGRYLLVLDDYHVIQDPAIHGVLRFLLDHLPPALVLAVAGRADPPLPLARLRGRGQLVELRGADLRFTSSEAAAFLNKAMGLALTAADVAALEVRTEGWITGLQLAALSLRGRDAEQVSGFLQSLSGSHRYILDYLAEEVLQQQQPGIQAFLLQTAILERLCGPLCEAVAGDRAAIEQESGLPTGQAVLEYLEANHLFILPLDDERRWYRYHRLFADLLRARLPQLGPGLGCPPAAELHRRASAWFEAQGQRGEAIGHALAAGDEERAADLVAEVGLGLLVRGELTTILGWLAALSDNAMRARPWLCVYHAWALGLSGQAEAAEARLQDAEAASAGVPPGERGGHIAAIRAYVAAHAADLPRAVELARKALDLLPAEERTVRSVVAFTLANVSRVQGDLKAASQALLEASALGQEGGNLHLAVSALCQLAGLEVEQGRLHDAAGRLRQALALAGDLPVAASAYSGLGALFYEWNDLPTAEEHLSRGLALHRRWGNTDAMAADQAEMLRLRLAQGDLAGAAAVLEEMVRLAEGARGAPASPFLATWAEMWDVYLALARDDVATAARWAAAAEAPAAAGAPAAGAHRAAAGVFLHEFRELTLARVYLALAREGRGVAGQSEADPLAKAGGLLSQMLAAAENDGRWGRAIEVLILLALVREAAGEGSEAQSLLERALHLAGPQGYVRAFVDEGAPLEALLRTPAGATGTRAGGKEDTSTGYAARLLAAFPQAGEDTAPAQSGRAPWPVEPLSERELEVLRMVAAGLTNREIGERLFIAVSTVKSHTNSIYGKLGVKNRTQAVARARELDLL